MRIHALISWYDESVPFLAAAVSSIVSVVDHVVAVDGAYAAFPNAQGRSNRLQAETIEAICEGAGVACTIHRPSEPWRGGEVEKRSRMFQLAEASATLFEDWYLVFDADCILQQWPSDTRQALADTECHTADLTLYETRDFLADVPDVARNMYLPTTGEQRMSMMFRALRNMQVVNTHYIYGGYDQHDEWCFVWAPHMLDPGPRLVLPQVRVEHRSLYRDKYRKELSELYYKTRDELGLERAKPREQVEQELRTIKRAQS